MKLSYPIDVFKSRPFDPRKTVRVHRNLHRKTWTLSQGGRVVAHADILALEDGRFIVSRAGWRRSREQGRRNVHAFVEGKLRKTLPLPKHVPARYNRETGYFEKACTGRRLQNAAAVLLAPGGMWVA